MVKPMFWLAALAITIHILESAVPTPLPGIKPGLANVVTVITLALFGWRIAAWVTLLRVLAASLLTGTYPQRHGVRRTKRPLPGSALTLAEVLRREGYTTCGVVTNGNLFPAFGFDQGFEEYKYGHGGAQAGTEIALDWIGQAGREPFFLWVHHTGPHTPYRPPAPFDDVFADEVEYGNLPLEIVKGSPLGGVHPGLLIEGPLDLDYYISQYDGEIVYTDYWVGKMTQGFDMVPSLLGREPPMNNRSKYRFQLSWLRQWMEI